MTPKSQVTERQAAKGLRTRLQFTQDSRQLLHDVTDEEVQAFGQVLIATLLLLAWSGLSAVSLDVHHQSTHGEVQQITSRDKRADSICPKTQPRQAFPGGTVPITLTFRFVATCQAQSISALEKSKHLRRKNIRQLIPLQCPDWPMKINHILHMMRDRQTKASGHKTVLGVSKIQSGTTSCLYFCCH